MRVPQPRGNKGSLKWIQELVAFNPAILTDGVRASFSLPTSWHVAWVSPREADSWAEYRDGDFLNVLGLGQLQAKLGAFWPEGGPQWDALGKASDGGVVLVEAKAHAGELRSTCGATDPTSIAKIDASLTDAKRALGVAVDPDWKAGHYQYANRLAHLHFLRTQGIAAYLAFVYFVGDDEMGAPQTRDGWQGALRALYEHLGLPSAPPHVCSVFIDVAMMPPRA